MYFASVLLLLFILPCVSILVEVGIFHHTGNGTFLVGKWFVFWGGGIRLFLAGLRQTLQPEFTAKEIFQLQSDESFPIVRELGFANLSMGFLSLCSIFRPGWVIPAAVVTGMYYLLAGVGHIRQAERNAKETMALVSDIFLFIVLAWFVLKSLLT